MEGETSYSVDEALVAVGFGKFQYFVLLYAGMGWVSEAMEMMLLSFVGPAVQSKWNVSSQQESLLTSVVFAGMLVGAYSWGIVSDKFGRRNGFFVTAMVTSVAGFLSATAPNYAALVTFRGLVGLGLGGIPVLLSYFLEFVPAPRRGTWMVIFQAFWTVGTLTEAGLAWIVMPRLGWRYLLGLSALPSLLLLIVYPMTPESPRYLCLKGKKHEALKILQKIAQLNGRELPPGVPVTDLEIEIRRSSSSESAEPSQGEVMPPLKSKDSDMGVIQTLLILVSRKLVRSTLLLWAVFFGNSFTYYGLVLLTTELNTRNNTCNPTAVQSQKSGDVDYKDVFITTFAELPGLVVAALVVDRLGRKISMAALFFICCIFLLPLVVHQSNGLTTTFLFGARACTMGTFTIAYIYAPEIYPTSVRSTGVGIASAMGRIGGMVSPLVAVSLVKGCHQTLAVVLFVGVALASAMAVLLFPYETKGLELADTISSNKHNKPKASRAEHL